MELEFTDDNKAKHEVLKVEEQKLNEGLEKQLETAKVKTKLFKDVKSHSLMLKPFLSIIKPFFACMVLRNQFYT